MAIGSNYVRYYSAEAASSAFARMSDAISGVSTTVENYNDRADYLQEQIDYLMKLMQESLPNAKKWHDERDAKRTEVRSTYSDTDDFEVDSDELDSFLSDFARTEG